MEDMVYTPEQGERLETAVDTMLLVAEANDCIVRIPCWNGVEIVVRPGDNVQAVVTKFKEDHAKKFKNTQEDIA